MTGPYTSSENDMYFGLHHKLDPRTLLMAARWFFSYQSFKDSAATGAHRLWQVHGSKSLPILEELEDGSYLSAADEGTKQRLNKVSSMPVRVVEFTVSNGTGASEFRLLTTLLNPDVARTQELAEAYAKRWEIEFCFKEMKTNQRGSPVVLGSKTPEGVLQVIQGYLCTHYALRTLIG